MTSPTVYEFVRDGQVVERVQPVNSPEDFENTRIGVAVLEAEEAASRGELGREYWRVAGQEIHNAPQNPTGSAGEPEPDSAAPARPASTRRSKEK